jgi:hypothetical protein
VVVAGVPDEPPAGAATIEDAVAAALAAGLSVRAAAADVSQRLGVGRREVYDVALRLSGRGPRPGRAERGTVPGGDEGQDRPLR